MRVTGLSPLRSAIILPRPTKRILKTVILNADLKLSLKAWAERLLVKR